MMQFREWLLRIIFIFAASLLVIGYILLGRWYISAGISLLLLIWAMLDLMKRYWIKNIMFAVMVLITAAGIWLDFPFLGLVICVTAFLIVWDLENFYHSLEGIELGGIEKALENQHLIFLFTAVCIGFVLTMLTELVKVRLTFVVGSIMSLFVVLGLVISIQLVERMR